MEYLIRIQEARYIEGKGFAIIGSNPNWTKDDLHKLNVKGKSVIIKTSEGDFSFEVIDLQISFSIIEHPLVGILVKESDDFSKIANGDGVYKTN